MSDKQARRGAGAPFYAPPRRKTSAEIISEARAAVYGEMSGSSGSAGQSGSGALRPLRTRRPFTPREPQRTLFNERGTRKKDTRPPSAFDLKYLSLNESNEETLMTMGARVAGIDDDTLNGVLFTPETKTNNNTKKKPALRNQSRSVQERSGDGWGGFPRLPHLSGRSKPLHRRSTSQMTSEESISESELMQAIYVTRPLGNNGDNIFASDREKVEQSPSKSLSPDSGFKRKQFISTKSLSCETNVNRGALGDIGVKHLAVQLPNTSIDYLDGLSILELCDALSHRTRDMERTVLLMEALQSRLESNLPASSLRDLVLRSLYTHIDCEDERVLVAIARACLTMRVTGTHLAAACKLIFKIARNDKNDHFFRDSNLLELLVEGCGRADPVTESECCVYGAGALRVLALEPRLCARAHKAGAVHLAAIHLKLLNNAKSENPRSVSEQSTHALYQLTGALRNLASETRAAHEFVTSGALPELVAALLLHTDRDVLTNVARCLSVLSVQECCCAWLCGAGSSVRALLVALAACSARAPLAVRLAYTLGNMAAADHRVRHNVYNEDGGIDVLLTILESYTQRNDQELRDPDSDPDLHLIGTDLGGSDGSNEDVLIKTARVVANLCLTERAGRGLAATYAERIVKALLACLELAERRTDHTGLADEQLFSLQERREELATAALATLNNITFYRDPPDPPDPLDDTLDRICRSTCRWLRGSGSAACEAIRALGNLTRSPRLAQLLVLDGALDTLAPFLDHEEEGIRSAAAGVLVNVCGAGAGAGGGGGEGADAGELAGGALRAAAARADHAAAALLARALWNAHAHRPVHADTARQAATALAMFIDDESVFAACEASRYADRRASDPSIKNHVTGRFSLPAAAGGGSPADRLSLPVTMRAAKLSKRQVKFELSGDKLSRTLSVERDLHTEGEDSFSGEDLGFEDGDVEECECGPCRRLASWEELVAVAIPLLEKLRPPRADASVGTD